MGVRKRYTVMFTKRLVFLVLLGMITGFWYTASQAEISRDNGRTPMQWSADTNAGFTRGRPWLKVNPNYRTVNVAAAERDTGSVLSYFRRMIRLRKAEPTLVYGRYRPLDRENPEVFAYTRTLGNRSLMVALSFSDRGGRIELPAAHGAGKILINNLPSSPLRGTRLILAPYQAVVLELTPSTAHMGAATAAGVN
jgi:oligo-1,6-glucosidase